MAKKKKRGYSPPPLPLEGVWISPEGDRIRVTEHLMALMEYPEKFNLTSHDIGGGSIPELRGAALKLLRNGWIRYRYLDGEHMFELAKARARMGVVEDLLAEVGAHKTEGVIIAEIDPDRESRGTVEDVWERRILRF